MYRRERENLTNDQVILQSIKGSDPEEIFSDVFDTENPLTLEQKIDFAKFYAKGMEGVENFRWPGQNYFCHTAITEPALQLISAKTDAEYDQYFKHLIARRKVFVRDTHELFFNILLHQIESEKPLS